jgi:hypothetical protein
MVMALSSIGCQLIGYILHENLKDTEAVCLLCFE